MDNFDIAVDFVNDQHLDLLEKWDENQMESAGNIKKIYPRMLAMLECYLSLKANIVSMLANLDKFVEELNLKH